MSSETRPEHSMFGNSGAPMSGGMRPEVQKHEKPLEVLRQMLDNTEIVGAPLHGANAVLAQAIDEIEKRLAANEADVKALKEGKEQKG